MQSEMPETVSLMVVTRNEPFSARLADRLSESDFDLEVVRVGSQELFVRLDEYHPDLVILDGTEPDPPALTTCRLVRRSENWAETDLIVLVGDGELPWEEEAYALGVLLCVSAVSPERVARAAEQMLTLQSAKRREEQQQEIASSLRSAVRASRQGSAEFIGKLSHEIRTPLGVIEGFTANLLDGICGELGAEQRESLEVVDRNIQRLKEFLGDVLHAARLDAEVRDAREQQPADERRGTSRQFRRRQIVVGELVSEVVQFFTESFRAKGVALEVRLPDSTPKVWLDPSKIRQVLTNLLSNALKFTQAGGRTVVAAQALHEEGGGGPGGGRRAANIEISVSDTGVGISKEQLPHIFGNFVRVEGAEATEGTGLGLAICKEIVEEHRGEISAVSVQLPGGGTTVSFTLPIDLRRRAPGQWVLCSDLGVLEGAVASPGGTPRTRPLVAVSSVEEARRALTGKDPDLLLLDSPVLQAMIQRLEQANRISLKRELPPEESTEDE